MMAKYATCNESLAHREEGQEIIGRRVRGEISNQRFIIEWANAVQEMHQAGACEGPAFNLEDVVEPEPREYEEFFRRELGVG
jgi:hypothetical protein